jgi:hypothetical protein
MCIYCGLTVKSYNVTDTTCTQTTDGIPKKQVRNKHDCSKFFMNWLAKIQGSSNVLVTDEDIRILNENLFYINKYFPETVSCNNIRNSLKEINRTDLNDQIPYLYHLVTGKELPQLTMADNLTILNRYNHVLEWYNKIETTLGRKSKPYYPFMVYKIIQHDYTDNSEILQILKFIHLPRKETTKKYDEIWKKICETSGGKDNGGFDFIPTEV